MLYNAKSTSFDVYSKKKKKNLETTRAFESINILLLTSVVLFGNCFQELTENIACSSWMQYFNPCLKAGTSLQICIVLLF